MLNNIISSVISNAITAALDKSIQSKTVKMAGESAEEFIEGEGREGEYTFFGMRAACIYVSGVQSHNGETHDDSSVQERRDRHNEQQKRADLPYAVKRDI